MKGSRTDESLAPTDTAETLGHLLGSTLEKLAAIEKRRKQRSEDLALGIEALAAVIELIQADPGSLSSNAAGPLKRVQVALHDLQHGAKPALIFERPNLDENRPRQGGKPSNTVSDGIRGQLAAAAHVLIDAGVPRKEAGAFVARGIAAGRIPIAGLGKGGVTANRVLRWRDEVGAASSRAFNESFNEIANAARDRLGSDIKRPEAEIVVMSVLTAAANWAA
jgi:hypothetical protein